MKKKISILLSLVLVCICIVAFAVTSLAEESEEQTTITVSYMKTQDTTSDTTTLDKVAYTDGKQVVGVGEKFTLPTTADNTYAGQDGFRLVWYTEDGRTYKAGEEVSFDKDTKLFRCVAKECYTMAEVNYAMKNESGCAILMADLDTGDSLGVWNQGASVLILNGFTLNITKNGTACGEQRSGKHIYGTGTVNITNPDGKLGSYSVFSMQSHGYNGSANRQVIGRDVVLNAPNFWLGSDGDGSYNNHYPWLRIYGTVNCYGFVSISNLNNRAPMVEIYDTATVTVNGPQLFKDNVWRANYKYSFNAQAFELRIYGGTFNLPAEAATQAFWTNDYTESYVDGSNNFYNYGLDKNTADVIRIFGGTFNVADGSEPAIADYLVADYIGSIPSGGNGLVKNNNTSTYHVCYMNRPGYKLAFEVYTDGTPAKLTVTDYVDGSLSGTYYYTFVAETLTKTDPYNSSEVTANTVTDIVVYEGREVTAEDGTVSTVYDVVTEKFALDFGMNGALKFSNSITQQDYKLQAQGDGYIVVPAGCEHSYEETVVEATCKNQGSVTYTCTLCGHSATTITEEKGAHSYSVTNHVEATLTSLGSKTLECSECGEIIERVYTVDPTSLEVKVTVRKDDDTYEDVTVLASEVFEFATSGVEGAQTYTVSAIKAFGDYSVRNIYGITIPKGILYVNITTHNYEKYNNVEYGVAKLTIADGANVDILNIGNLRKVETITVEKNADVVFASSCSWYSPNNERRDMQKIATIDLSAGNHSVKFMTNAFEGRSTLTALKLGENANYDFSGSACFRYCKITELNLPTSSTYSKFGSESFRENAFVSLTFPDNLDLTFDSSTFYNCKSLTSVEFGENSTYVIGSSCFRYSPIPKVVLTPNSTYTINSQAFINSALTELDMSAGNMTVTFNGSAFNCWLDNKVYCTLSTINFGENSTYTFAKESFSHSSITDLVLAGNSTYTFSEYTFHGDTPKSLLTTIDASASGITATWNGNAFRERTALATLKFGENGNHTFNGSAFYNTAITELKLAAKSKYVFNANAFNGNTPLAKVDASADGITVDFNRNAFEGKSTVAELLINGKNSTYTFSYGSFNKSTVTTLTFGEGSTYTFNDYPFNNNSVLATLDFTASNVNATFKQNSLTNSSISYLAFGENSNYTIDKYSFSGANPTNEIVFHSNSTFTIGQEAFKGADFASVVFEDDVDVTFTGARAFYDCNAATYLYLGKNFELSQTPFKNMKALEKIVIMDGAKFIDGGTYFFENAGSADFATPLVVYNHSTDITFTEGMFNNCDGIVLYTATDNIGTRTDVFRNCADGTGYKGWTVVLGIPHAIVQGQSDPTCTVQGGTNWIASDCPCGLVIREELTINIYENKHNITADTEVARVETYEIDPIAPLGHTKGEFVTIVYPNGYHVEGTAQYNCPVCLNAEGYYEEVANAIVVSLGYSVSEFGDKISMTQGFVVDVNAFNAYKTVNTSFTYGVLATVNLSGEAITPITVDESGALVKGDNVLTGGFITEATSYFDVKIVGVSEKIKDIEIVLCAYVFDGSKVQYVDDGELTETVVGVAYSSIATE